VEETEACSSLLSLLHTVPLLHCTRGRLSLGPGPVLYPATPCHMAQDVSRVQKLKISFAIFFNQASLSVCGPWHIRLWLGCTENCRISVPTSVHGPWPVRWCTAQVQNSSNTFSCHHTKYTAFCIQPNCGTQCRSTNVCSSSCRGHTTSRSLLCTCRPWTGLRRVCQPNLALSHIPLQYQLYPFSNSCFIPTMFFDLIMTKQCLNREDVKHRISLQYGCMHCQLSPWQEFWQHWATKQHQVPFLKLLQRPHKICFSVFFQHHFVSQVQLWFHRNHHLITLFLFYRCLWHTRRIPEGTMLEVTSRCRNVISAVCHHSTVLSNQDCYLVIVPTVICRWHWSQAISW